MSSTIYQRGDQAFLRITWKNVDGELTDPTTVTLKIMSPDETVVTVTWAGAQVMQVSLGIFSYVLDVPTVGVWRIRWIAAGALVDETEDYFEVESTTFP